MNQDQFNKAVRLFNLDLVYQADGKATDRVVQVGMNLIGRAG